MLGSICTGLVPLATRSHYFTLVITRFLGGFGAVSNQFYTFFSEVIAVLAYISKPTKNIMCLNFVLKLWDTKHELIKHKAIL